MRQANELQPQRMPQRWYEHCYSSGPRGRRSRCRPPAPPGFARCSRSRRRSERRRRLSVRPLRRPPPGAPPAAGDVTLTAERARLRAQLDRVNAEIDALKRSARGVGDDYRLRARLADAEALARRLIDIEARLGLRAPAVEPGPLPVASPTDSPSDLQAKADILDDRARRVRLEADALDHRVVELKGRQDLRRRAADLDRDPFAPLEGSKRRVMTIAATDSSGHATAPAALPTGSAPQTPIDRPGGSLTTSTTSGGTSAPQSIATPAGSAPPTPLTGTAADGAVAGAARSARSRHRRRHPPPRRHQVSGVVGAGAGAGGGRAAGARRRAGWPGARDAPDRAHAALTAGRPPDTLPGHGSSGAGGALAPRQNRCGARCGAGMVLGMVLGIVHGTARAQTDGAPDTERYTLRAEVGLEYDTNAHRTEIVAGANNPPLVASPLERLVLAGTLSDQVADGQLLTLAATAAGKIYDAPAAYRRGRRHRPVVDRLGEDARTAGDADALRRLLRGLPGACEEPRRCQRTARLSLSRVDRPARLGPGRAVRPVDHRRLPKLLVQAGSRRRLQRPDRRRRAALDPPDQRGRLGGEHRRRVRAPHFWRTGSHRLPAGRRRGAVRLRGPRHPPRRVPHEPPRPAARRRRALGRRVRPSSTTARTATARRSFATS